MLIQTYRQALLLPLFLFSFMLSTATASPVKPVAEHGMEQGYLHHTLDIEVDLANSEVTISDTIRLPEPRPFFDFQLNNKLTPIYNGQTLVAKQVGKRLSLYRIPLGKTETQLSLRYTGQLPSTSQCRFTLDICSLLNEDGIYLNPATGWYPMSVDLQTFDLRITLPDGWLSVSQGKEVAPNHWQTDKPQDTIYLLAGAFKRYESQGEVANAQVYLLNDDARLAERYLKATHQYLQHYQRLLGDYPYTKFATVESFWETGWGMPSFTLLGSRVMRMPFILHTSFPHEILHNWWGNGVYVDSSLGNWSEGLTAYLSDHGLQEASGKDIAYRRTALDKYAVFTQRENDFPIQDFRSRHNAVTQAIGYSKLLMVFHMLRKDLGDELFYTALQNFYQDYQFKHASMNDLVASLSKSSKKDLHPFFKQWITQPDAPTLALKNWHKTSTGVDITLTQTSTQKPFSLHIPLIAYDRDGKHIWEQVLTFNDAEKTFKVNPPATASKLLIDPEFDVLRKPLATEIPPNLHSFRDPGLKSIQIASDAAWWNDIAEQLVQTTPQGFKRASNDKAETTLQLGLPAPLKKQTLSVDAEHYLINDEQFDRHTHTLVFADRKSDGHTQIVIDSPTEDMALQTLAKLRHYGKYSYLIFDQNARNVLKGEWDVETSPLSISLDE